MSNTATATKSGRENATATADRPIHILLVDDDPDTQTSLATHLRGMNVEVHQAFHGMQGIAEAVRIVPDLILLDIAMPNGNGEYLMSCIRRTDATSQIPVVVFTGMRDPALRSRLINAGASAYIRKPVLFKELLRVFKQFVPEIEPLSAEAQDEV